MSSKKRKTDKNVDEKKHEKTQKHPGGPLQRKGGSADSWNEAVGESLEVIPLSQLPTKRTILRKYRYLRINAESTLTSELVKLIAKEVQYIWNCARVPICSDKNCCLHISSVINWWNDSSKFPPQHRTKPEFQRQLDDLLDIAEKPKGRYTPEKGLEYLRNVMKNRGKKKTSGFAIQSSNDSDSDWENDLEFYIDQKGPRKKKLGPVDSKLTKKEAKSTENVPSTSSSSLTMEEAVDTVATESSSQKESEESDDDYQSGSTTHTEQDDYIVLKLPKKDTMRQLSPLSYRLKLSNRQQTALVAGLVKIGGGSLKDTTLSVTSTHRQRCEGIEKTSTSIRESFKSNMPLRMVLHWDGKIIKYEKKKKMDDRLCVIGSFPGVTENAEKKPDQFFGAPLVHNGTGRVAADTLVRIIAEWDIPASAIIGMCWDTTASNTGHKEGSATHFESRLMHALLWIACRHHMGELHVKHADIKVRVLKSSAPEDLMFKRFQKIFESLPPCNYRLFEWPIELIHPTDFLTTRALEVLEWAQEQLRKGTFNKQRDDYRELCELVVVYLGGQVFRARKGGALVQLTFKMRHPGAFHHARFLAKALYLIKISMMADVLPDDVLPADKRSNVDRLAKFIAIFHAKYFLQALLPAAAPRLDLEYWKDMCEYSRYDDEISDEVQSSIKRHLWYLTEELSILSIFDQGLGFDCRTDIATTLLSFPKPQGFLPSKPTFPRENLLSNDPEIKKFIGPRSWLLFDLLQIDNPQWLYLPAEQWESDEQFLEMDKIVQDLPVVNDTAERAVKKVTEYANSANDGGQRGKIVEVAAWHHTKMSAYTKDDLENVI